MNQFVKLCFLLFAVHYSVLINVGYSQNLVPNPSFEAYSACPDDNNGGRIFLASPWYSPVDNLLQYPYLEAAYCNECASTTGCCGVPINYNGKGYQYARSGKGFSVIFFYAFPNDRTYIQVKLLDSLKVNHCYLVSFYVNLENNQMYSCNNFSALLTDTPILVTTQNNQFGLLKAKPQVTLYNNPVIKDTLNWVKIAGVYTAHGGERFLTIGNFYNDTNTVIKQFQFKGENAAGYDIDDVGVVDIDSTNFTADAGRDTAIKLGDSVFIGSLTSGLTTQWYNSSGQQIASDVPGLWVKPTASTWYRIVQNVCGHVSSDTVNVTVGVLPVVLKGFSATPQGHSTLLQWVTATEVNASHFVVQRSGDEVHFSSIGTVAAKGAGSYNFIYKEPLEGNNYYRLEMVDRDGSREWSKVVEVSFSSTLNFSIAPNPAINTLTVAAKGLQTVALIDNVGKVVLQKSFTDKVVLDVSGLARGLYFVRVIDKEGSVQMGKVVLE